LAARAAGVCAYSRGSLEIATHVKSKTFALDLELGKTVFLNQRNELPELSHIY